MKPAEESKKPVKKVNGADDDLAKPIRKPEPKLGKKDRIKKRGKQVGTVTKDLIKTSGYMAKHPGKSAYVIVTSSGEVVGEISAGMLKSGGVVVRKSKNGLVLVKGSAERISGAEEADTKEDYNKRMLFFFGPLLALILIYCMYFVFFDFSKALTLLGTALAYLIMIPGVDKSTLVLSANTYGISPYQMAINLWFEDALLGTFLCLNFVYVKRIPFFGKLIANFEEIGSGVLTKYPWLKRLSLIGLFIFIVLPFQGSGALAGSIIGRMIGMKASRVIPAVIIGTFTGLMILAYSADLIRRYFPPVIQIIVPVVIFSIIITAVVYSYIKKKKREKDPHYQLYVKPIEELEKQTDTE